MNVIPEMSIVAGPPGSGKSTAFSLLNFADRAFNSDDRAAELNGRSYRSILPSIRQQVNVEFEAFVRQSISLRLSFALETTLRSGVTFEQARMAKAAGFQVSMIYVCLDAFERHLERVRQRAFLSGHAASETTLRRIYDSSLANLPVALDAGRSGIDRVRVFDNTSVGQMPRLIPETTPGRFIHVAADLPAWLPTALH